MRRLFLVSCLWLLQSATLHAQQTDAQPAFDFYLGGGSYDPAITKPAAFLGWEPGTWHVTPEAALAYYRHLDQQSDRITQIPFGRTWEQRPLIAFVVSAPENLSRLEEIRTRHLKFSDPKSSEGDPAAEPVVLWQGFSVHGNEPSGANAALLYMYHLAASNDAEVTEALKKAVILVDPVINPDGGARFANWANSRRSTSMASADPNDAEHNEPWPRGRTNHYWFDLNRDWLPVVHPESQGRLRLFKQWMPNVLTDHHEMGTNATFFFQPGIPSRTNPLTPKQNIDLTGKIAAFHGEALDKIGSYYYTRESFDDFYYGKGSTYPDIQGAIGILFEQASSRGHRQESVHGVLSFAFTIKNQLTAARSTLKAAVSLRQPLLEHQRWYFRTALDEGSKDPVQGYVIGDAADREKVRSTAKLLLQHKIEVYELSKDLSAGGNYFTKGAALVIPSAQPQYKLVKSLFTKTTRFEDSLFYDISAWTLPFALDLPYAELDKGRTAAAMGSRIDSLAPAAPVFHVPGPVVGLYAAPGQLNLHRFLSGLMESGLLVKVITEPAQADAPGGKIAMPQGSLFIPVFGQPVSEQDVTTRVQQLAKALNVDVYGTASGLAQSGIDAGSPSSLRVSRPAIALVVGEGTVSNDAGELWHLLDAVQGIPVTLLPVEGLQARTLARYNRLILPNGSYTTLGKPQTTAVRDWVRNGGVLIAVRGAISWLSTQEIAAAEYSEAEIKPEAYVPYSQLEAFTGSQEVAGAIFEARIDPTHPLGWGYADGKLSVFRDHNRVLKPSTLKSATPVQYLSGSHQAGWVSAGILKKIQGSAESVVYRSGTGRIILFADNPNFRSFFTGPNRMFLNAVFFGDLIRSGSAEPAGGE